jgi:peptidyl-prolyl cis-trans isomerase SurA
MRRTNISYRLFCLALLVLARPLPAERLLDRVIAIVGSEIILYSDLQQKMQVQLQQMQVRTTEEFIKYMRDPAFQNQVLESLIADELLLVKAEQDSIEVDRETVDENIKERMQMVKKMYTDDGFKEELKREGLTEKEFRERMRDDIEKQLKREKVMMGLAAQIKVTRRDIETFFTEHQDELPAAPDSVRICHILLPVMPDSQAALEKVKAVQAKLAGGADFADLARGHSEDPGSGQRGGELGWFGKGDMVGPFDKAVFGLEPGQVSEPVLTKFGYHIIKLLGKKDDKVHASHILIALKVSEKEKEAVKARARAIKAELAGDLTFEAAAEKYSADTQTKANGGDLGWRQVNQLPDEFITLAKKLPLGQVSDPVMTPLGHHLVKVKGRKEAAPLSLDSNYEALRNMARNQKILKEIEKVVTAMKDDVYIENRLQQR